MLFFLKLKIGEVHDCWNHGKQQAKSEPRHFKTCPKTLCATPCNSPETLLRESTTKWRGWFHLPSHFEHHQSSHFASNLLQKSYRKLRGRIKNLNEKEFQCFKSRILKMTFVWNTAKNSKTCWWFSLLVGVGTCEDNWEDKLRFTSGWCLAVVSLWYVVIELSEPGDPSVYCKILKSIWR